MRAGVFVVIAVTMALSCAHAREGPIAPGGPNVGLAAVSTADRDDPHRLWGEWTFYIPASHDRVEVVPQRQGRFHLNALKFLESYCTDCLKIMSLKNNGDGTIDLVVRITHPFKGHPEYTAFDVKGIIMFDGSYEYGNPFSKEPPYPEPYRISWRLRGDPELLNPDGWTWRWSPSYDSGSDLPMFNYWPGKHSMGCPTANLNGFRNFYTHDQRHMFATDGTAERTYRIWLPPGEPVVAGYAVEACWEPPIKTPVTDPLNDFPISANQSEPYIFNLVVNNNEPITKSPCCGFGDPDYCSDLWVECAAWSGITPGYDGGNTYVYFIYLDGDYTGVGPLFQCYHPEDGIYSQFRGDLTEQYPDGAYRELVRFCTPPTAIPKNVVIDVYDFTIDLD